MLPFSVIDFGAKGNGVTDDTIAIQAAINAAGIGGVGGVVVFPRLRYYTTGTLTVPDNVSLQGIGTCNLGSGLDPRTALLGATILVTNTSTTPFISLPGNNNYLADLIFAYPNQVANSAASPNVYAPTVAMVPGTEGAISGLRFSGVLFYNSYVALSIGGAAGTAAGVTHIENCVFGFYSQGLVLDHCFGSVLLLGCYFGPQFLSTFTEPVQAWIEQFGLRCKRIGLTDCSGSGAVSMASGLDSRQPTPPILPSRRAPGMGI